MKYYYNPKVKLLLIPHSEKKEKMRYDDNSREIEVPMIGPRPPFYDNPRYKQYYPVI
ncbi:hypothetical protein [Oceanobacillus halophilus]|uniref:hypothetical protein n=1 Tax=Oceanobacillus halophilus TaxID=930130 RepID=UPI001474B78F|nr:hypothetical protein [Oceanobacillus halophilus]